jgi:hypothetical protein
MFHAITPYRPHPARRSRCGAPSSYRDVGYFRASHSGAVRERTRRPRHLAYSMSDSRDWHGFLSASTRASASGSYQRELLRSERAWISRSIES